MEERIEVNDDVLSEVSDVSAVEGSDVPSGGGDGDDVSSGQGFSVIDHLVELGFVDSDVLSEVEDKNDLSAIAVRARERVERGAIERLINSLPTDARDYLKLALSSGISIDDYYEHLRIPSYDLGVEEDQRRVIRDYLSATTNLSEDKISKLISLYEDSGTLSAEASEAANALNEYYERRRVELERKAEEERRLQEEAERSFIEGVSKELKEGSIVHPNRRSKVSQFLFETVKDGDLVTTRFNLVLKSLASNPSHLVQLADILVDYDPKVGINLSRFSRRSVSDAVSKLEDALKESTKSSRPAARQNSTADNVSSFLENWIRS